MADKQKDSNEVKRLCVKMADYKITLRRLGHPDIILKPKHIEVMDTITKGTLKTIAILPTGYAYIGRSCDCFLNTQCRPRKAS